MRQLEVTAQTRQLCTFVRIADFAFGALCLPLAPVGVAAAVLPALRPQFLYHRLLRSAVRTRLAAALWRNRATSSHRLI